MHPNCFTYTIRKGDTLYELAKFYKTSVSALLLKNPGIDPYNLQIGSSLIICSGNFDNNFDSFTPKMMELKNELRLLWSQHVYWTRMLLISIAERLNDQKAVETRILQNPSDIANVYAEFYHNNAANNIEQLLTEHLQIGAMIITSLRDGKKEEADKLVKQWYINADKMAKAFSSINPYYDYDELKKMLYNHLELTTQEVAMRLSGNYSADIDAFNTVEKEAMLMADYFSSGIIQQFPQSFN